MYGRQVTTTEEPAWARLLFVTYDNWAGPAAHVTGRLLMLCWIDNQSDYVVLSVCRQVGEAGEADPCSGRATGEKCLRGTLL